MQDLHYRWSDWQIPRLSGAEVRGIPVQSWNFDLSNRSVVCRIDLPLLYNGQSTKLFSSFGRNRGLASQPLTAVIVA